MQIVAPVFYEPLLLAVLAVAVALIVTRGPRAKLASTDRAAFLRRVAVIGSLAVLAPYLVVQSLPYVDTALRYLAPAVSLDLGAPFEYRWWLFPLPVVAAVVVLAIVLARLGREGSHVEQPVNPVVRRAWLTFSRRRDVAVAASAFGSLLVVSLLAGLASATDANGLHTLILIPGAQMEQPIDGPPLPNGSNAGSSTFFGWAYSVPVLAAAALLVLLAVLILHTNSARPFTRPDSVASETADRNATSATVLGLLTAAVLLPLGGALGMIGSAGLGSTGVGIPGVGTFMWSVGYAAFAPAIFGVGVILQAAAIVMLALAIRGKRAPRAVVQPSTVLTEQP